MEVTDLRSCPVWVRPELDLYRVDLWMLGCMSPWTHLGWVFFLATADIGARSLSVEGHPGECGRFCNISGPMHSIVTTIDVPKHCVPVAPVCLIALN